MATAMLIPVKLMKLAMNPLEEELAGLVGHTWKLKNVTNFRIGFLGRKTSFYCEERPGEETARNKF